MARGEEDFFQLAPDTLGGKVCEVNRAAQLDRRGFDVETEAGGELCRAQHAQRVFDEGFGRDGAQELSFNVGATAERVYHLARERGFEDGVDGEVAAARGLLEGHRGVALDVEGPVAAASLALTPRQAHVQILAELVDAERLADDVNAPQAVEQRAQDRRLYPVDLHVPVLRSAPHQTVAHATADHQRAPARVAHGARQPQNFFGDGRRHLRERLGRVRRRASLNGGGGAGVFFVGGLVEVVFGGRVFIVVIVSFGVLKENLHAARRGQATDDLHALDARSFRRGVPELDPEAARVAVDDEGRA